MAYQKIGTIIRKANPNPRNKPILSKEEIRLLGSIGKVILAIIAGAGIVALAAVAPNIFVAIDKLYRMKGKKLNEREKEIKTSQAFYYLKKSGLVKMKHEKNGIKVLLSKLGKKKAEKIDFGSIRVPKAGKWDKKWWQIAADIPTKKYRQGADLLRKKLREMGFCPLQRTLWFYPYDPRAEIEFITIRYGISQFVTVMEISRLDIEDEKILKAYFKSNGIF